MDLKNKLSKYYIDAIAVRPSKSRSRQSNISKVVDGEEAENTNGRYYRTITVYPEDYIHGNVPLQLIRNIAPNTFALVGKDIALEKVDLTRAVFLDTETTGLAGGTGTVPFLIGLGYYSDDGFQVEQLFMRDFHEEAAVLQAVTDRMLQSDLIVSYNGKAYDVNILTSRYILSRMRNPVIDMRHLDLLFTTRCLWRRRLSDCSLTNIERHILDFHRQGDVPSYLIPQLYFDFLRTRDAHRLASVFKHNCWDIVTLAALAGSAARIFENPALFLRDGKDLFSLGRAFWGLARLEDAEECYKEALNFPSSPEETEEIKRHLGLTLKRLGRWEEAVDVWQAMIAESSHSINPYEELAKYLEHRLKDYREAINVVDRALERLSVLEAIKPDLFRNHDRRVLEHRKNRLRGKLNRHG